MDKASKSKLIQELLPDIVELLSNAIEKLEKPTTSKASVASKKRGKSKTTKTVKTTKLAKTSKPGKASKSTKIKTGRPDFDHKTPGFIDDLTLEPELIKIDTKVCKKTSKPVPRERPKKTKCECGKMFDSWGSYLCDTCLLDKTNVK